VVEFYRSGGRPPALIISDYELAEDMTGDRAIAEARACLQRQVPAFIVTGTEDADAWARLQAQGFAVLRKPVKPARLRALINHLLC
jgi:CheY-like chemotaxis protein